MQCNFTINNKCGKIQIHMIISLINQKGGVGKTTLAVNIADCLHLKNKRVLLIDSDPQGSCLNWASTRSYQDKFEVISISRPTLHKEVKKFSGEYDYIIIDAPPRSYDVARSVLMASNFVLIPVQPSPYDVWATQEIVELVKECTVFNETMKSAFVINRKITNTAISRDVIKAFKDKKIPVLNSAIYQRVVYAETAANGKSVLRVSQKSIAKTEITNLTKEILNLLK